MRMIIRVCVLSAVLALVGGPALTMTDLHGSAPTIGAPAAPLSHGVDLSKLTGAPVMIGMAIKIKDTGSLAQKYKTRASAAQGDYKSGVESAGADWEAGAKAGESNYEAGVQEAIGKKRYGRGIASAGAAKYVKNAVDLGVQRYPQGVNQGVDAWAKGVQPALDMLKGLNLPPRGARRSPANQARANMVALELGKLKDRG
jgi:hypothetical protein